MFALFAPNPMRDGGNGPLSPYLLASLPPIPMPFCSRCAVLALALFALTAAGCSSNNPDDIDRYQGTFAFTELSFESAGINTANVGSRLTAASSEIEIIGEAASVKFRYSDGSTCGSTGSSSGFATMNATASRTSLTLEARDGADRDVLRCLLLPNSFRLTAPDGETDAQTLTATIERSSVDLNEYQESNYNAGLDNVSGTLTIRLTRRN